MYIIIVISTKTNNFVGLCYYHLYPIFFGLWNGGINFCLRTKAENERLQWQPLGSDVGDKSNQPKCEAYMMTGEHILKISNTTQTQKIIPKKQKKVINIVHPLI